MTGRVLNEEGLFELELLQIHGGCLQGVLCRLGHQGSRPRLLHCARYVARQEPADQGCRREAHDRGILTATGQDGQQIREPKEAVLHRQQVHLNPGGVAPVEPEPEEEEGEL